MLARRFLDVGFQIIYFQIISILEADIVTFGAQNQSFGMPGASTLAPWVTMGRSRGTWGLKKEDLGVQAWILAILRCFRDPILRAFRVPWTKIGSFFPGHFFK